MSEDRRLLLAVLLAIGIYAGWSWMLMARRRAQLAAAPPAPAKVVPKSAPIPAPVPVPVPPTPAAKATPEAPEKLVTLDSPELHLVFSTRGGTLERAELLKAQYRRRVDDREVPVDLVRGKGSEGLALQTRFAGANWSDDPTADYEVTAEPSGRALEFRRRVGGATLTKRFELISPYLLSMRVSVAGGTAKEIAIDYGGEQPPGSTKAAGGFLSHLARSYPNVATAICRVDGSNKSSASDKDEQVTLPAPPKTGVVQFGGVDERFFIAAVEPQDDRQGTCTVSSTRAGRVDSEIALPLAAGAPIDRTFGVFLGPKDLDLLQRSSALPGQRADSELATSVGFGFWTALCVPMLRAMELFHRWLPNWGVAILVLTVLMKLLLWPLTHAQYRSMEKMKALQPKMAELKTKFGEDKERLNLEMMKLYTENKVNPLGGCLPMLIQLPIWWALYRLLGTTIQLYHAPFIGGWINDLTAPDPFFALPIGMGVTMLGTQALSPQLPDSGQQRLMMWMMPVMMTFFFLNLPAGLNLYIVASNLLSIGQQAWVRGRTAVPAGNVPA